MTTFQAIQDAALRLAGVAHKTPIMHSHTLDRATGRSLFLKCENFQRGGAFKFRGAYNAISQLNEQERARGVLAYSSGNHAQGVALAASLLGIPAVICMPDDAPAVKMDATRGYGAEVITYDRQRDDRETFTKRIAAERGMTVVPPFDHPAIVAGAGTAVLELLAEMPELDTLLVPVGGGGLISGSALAAHGVNPRITVYGVEPEDGDDVRRSLASGERTSVPPPQTIADGLRTPMPGAITFPIIQQHVAEVLTVTDDEIREAMRFLLLRMKLVIEPSGAVGVAAALAGKLPAGARTVGVVISGGNIDPAMLASLWPNES